MVVARLDRRTIPTIVRQIVRQIVRRPLSSVVEWPYKRSIPAKLGHRGNTIRTAPYCPVLPPYSGLALGSLGALSGR